MIWKYAVVLATIIGMAQGTRANNIVFPPDSGVIDVTKTPYNATGDGESDCTAALQKAIDDHPSSDMIIYLPNGIYLISDTLKWASGTYGGVAQKRIIIQGQSTSGTIIRLKDRCEGFQDVEKPRSIIWTGCKPAQRFRNGIRTMTIHSGIGNPGAIGVQYIANNQGSMRNVKIVSDDGAGPIGLDLGYTNEQGPCLIQDVHVVGFDVGISMEHAVDSVTLERVTVEKQNVVGVRNEGQCASIRNLRSLNVVPAVENNGGSSVMTLLDSELTGGTEGVSAVTNSGTLFARNITIEGYAQAIRSIVEQQTSTVMGPRVHEFVSHPVLRLFGQGDNSLTLPIKETPIVPWGSLTDWVAPNPADAEMINIIDNRGRKQTVTDHTRAIQIAIDSGKSTLYFPYDTKWTIHGVVEVRGNIHRIEGLENRLSGDGLIKIVDGNSPVVVFDRFDLIYRQIRLEQASNRTLVISGTTFGQGDFIYSGQGDVYLEDVCLHSLHIGKGQKVWARQLNCEMNGETKIVNDGGQLWILGYKTENTGSVCHTMDGGRTEIVGGFIYSNQDNPLGQPMFIVENASFSATIGESNYRGKSFNPIVRETRGDTTKELIFGAVPKRGNASIIPLFVSDIQQ